MGTNLNVPFTQNLVYPGFGINRFLLYIQFYLLMNYCPNQVIDYG